MLQVEAARRGHTPATSNTNATAAKAPTHNVVVEVLGATLPRHLLLFTSCVAPLGDATAVRGERSSTTAAGMRSSSFFFLLSPTPCAQRGGARFVHSLGVSCELRKIQRSPRTNAHCVHSQKNIQANHEVQACVIHCCSRDFARVCGQKVPCGEQLAERRGS